MTEPLLRTVLASLALVMLQASALADEGVKLVPAPDTAHIYTATETVTVDTALRLDVPRPDGGTDTISGSATDKYVYVIARVPQLIDAQGNLLKQRVEFTKHELTQSRIKPGETASEQTYAGEGPLQGSAYEEEWKGEYFQRRITRQPNTSFGANPLELRQELDVRNKRGHPLLPTEPVAVGATWKPDTAELSRQLLRFGRKGKLEPEFTAEGKLTRLEAGLATVEVSIEVKNLLPLDSLSGAEWREGTTLTLTMQAKLVFDVDGRFVRSVESTITAKVSGELFRDGQWLGASATTTHRRVSDTVREPKPAQNPDEQD